MVLPLNLYAKKVISRQISEEIDTIEFLQYIGPLQFNLLFYG